MLRKVLMFLVFFPLMLKAQQKDTIAGFGHIMLDDVVITAVQQGLNIQDLIDIMQYDSTLYISFNQLHFANYTYQNDLKAIDKKEKTNASKKEKVQQTYIDKCRSQEILEQQIEGNLRNKKGGDRYYTAELFNRTLFNKHPVCNETPKTNWKKYLYEDKTGGHLDAIKRVIFNPGAPVDLPLIGNKFALFDESMKRYYDYSITRKIINSEECFVFSIVVKPKYKNSRKEVVIRKLVTAFRKSDFQIIKRDYEMLYKGAAVKLDIKMQIDLAQIGKQVYPIRLDYDGFFNVPLKKPERIQFITKFDF